MKTKKNMINVAIGLSFVVPLLCMILTYVREDEVSLPIPNSNPSTFNFQPEPCPDLTLALSPDP